MNHICKWCGNEFPLKKLMKTNGRCPNCGTEISVLEYCAVRPITNLWHLFFAAPWSIKIVVSVFIAISLFLVIFFSWCMVFGIEHGGVCLFFLMFLLYIPIKIFFKVLLRFLILGGGLILMPLVLCLVVYSAIKIVVVTGSVDWSLVVCSIFLTFLTIINFLPSSRRWALECYNKKRVFVIANRCNLEAAKILPNENIPPRRIVILSVFLLVGSITLSLMAVSLLMYSIRSQFPQKENIFLRDKDANFRSSRFYLPIFYCNELYLKRGVHGVS